MSLRQLYEALLIELHKEHAPNITLETFNYLANKAVYLYINKRYNIYDVSLQTTDDLSVLKGTAILEVHKNAAYDSEVFGRLMDATYTVQLPDDYFHLLSCMCLFKVNNTYKCYPKGSIHRATATRLTADSWSEVVDNYWFKPTYLRPYYYINNVNTSTEVPTLPYNGTIGNLLNIGNDISLDTKDAIFIADINSNEDDIKESHENSKQSYYYITYDSENSRLVLKKATYNSITKRFVSYDEITAETKIEITAETNRASIPGVSVFNTLGVYKFKSGKISEISNNIKLISRANTTHSDTDEEYLDPFKLIDINGFMKSTTEENNGVVYPQRTPQVRYGNASKVMMEIRYGTDDSVFELKHVFIDYIKTPQHLNLTQEQVDRTLDTSQILEFKDYVCLEIINELVHITMENISDLRLQTHPVVSLSIANPAQQLTETTS